MITITEPAQPKVSASTKQSERLAAARKAFATLAARAALAGQTCETVDGAILLSRWGRTAEFATVDAASAWLDQVTGGRA